MDEARLRSIPLFESLSRRERREVARHADEIDIPEGRRLVSEGRFSHEFFVIEEGSAEVTLGDRHVADLGPGDFLGEMGPLNRARRNATITATSPMTVMVMTARDLRQLDVELPDVHHRLRDAVQERAAALSA